MDRALSGVALHTIDAAEPLVWAAPLGETYIPSAYAFKSL
jgi:hypothetical protein